MDDALRIGALIELDDGRQGIIEQLRWRSVQLRQVDRGLIIIPNSLFANTTLKNLDKQNNIKSVDMRLTLDFSISVKRVIRVLSAALHSSIQTPGLVSTPAPVDSAQGPGEFGNIYNLRCFYTETEISEQSVRTLLTTEVMKHLKSTGLAISLPKQNLFLGRVRTLAMNWENLEDRQVLISNIDLFKVLEAEELAQLSNSVVIHTVAAGQKIITEGETSTSMYGLAEGLLQVSISRGENENLNIAIMEPGEFFGEMSMLAGEPRSATVTTLVDSVIYELSRDSFNEVLSKRTEIVESISRLIAERQMENIERLDYATRQERIDAIETATVGIVERIKSVFAALIKDRSKQETSMSSRVRN